MSARPVVARPPSPPSPPAVAAAPVPRGLRLVPPGLAELPDARELEPSPLLEALRRYLDSLP